MRHKTDSTRRVGRVAACTLLFLLSSSAAQQLSAQTGDFSIRIGDIVGIDGGVAEIDVTLVSPAEDIIAVQFDVCDDDLVDIDFSGVTPGAGFDARAAEELVISFGNDAWSASVTMATGNALVALVDHELFVAEYELLEVGSGTVEACGSLLPALLTTAAGEDVEPFVEPGDVFVDDAIPFLRGDINGDGRVEALLDSIYLLTWAFSGGAAPPCLDAADANNNGSISALSDGLYVLNWQFSGGNEPALPGTETCGPDPEKGNDNCGTAPEPCPSEILDLEPDASIRLFATSLRSVVEFGSDYRAVFGIEIEGDGLQGFQFGVCQEAGLDAPDAAEDLALEEIDGLDDGFDYLGISTDDGGWTIGVVVALTGSRLLEAGTYDLVTATYTTLEVGEWAVSFCDTLGDPPIPARAIREAEFVRPEIDDPATVTVVEVLIDAYLRGDVDGNGDVSPLLDGLALLQWGFKGGAAPPCLDAADVDDIDGVSALTDALFLLSWGFLGGDAPPAPGVEKCGLDPTEDDTSCDAPPTACL